MPAPPNLPGGQLYMEYKHLPSGERHTLRIHLAWFDPTAVDVTNNRLYRSDGPVVPTDATIWDTYSHFAALWQQYYNADWELRCVALLQYDSFTQVVQTPTPNFPVYNGTDTTEVSGKLYFERKFKLLSRSGSRRELVLAQVLDTTLRSHAFYVGASSGGVDARDQALMAYFSGASGTGFVMPDGNYAFSDTEMSVWWSKQPEGTFNGDCLVFPLNIDNTYPHPRLCAVSEDGTTQFQFHLPPEGGTTEAVVKLDAQQVTWDGLGSVGAGSAFEVRQVINEHDLRIIDTDGQDFRVFSTDGEIDGTLRLVMAYIAQQWKLYVDEIPRLVVPFPGTPIEDHPLVAKPDSDGNLIPTWSTNTDTTSTGTERLGGDGDTIPLGSDTCTGMRCGVSGECTKHLVSLYGAWADWLGPLVAGITDFALLALVIDPFFDALIGGLELATDIAIAGSIKKVLELGVGAITGSLFPSPSSDDQEAIQLGLFCQLTCTGTTVGIASNDINPVWHDHVAGLTLDGLSRDLLCILIQFTPLADWQAISLHAGTSGSCDAWSCP